MNSSLIGKKFRNIKGQLCHVVNEFIDDNVLRYEKLGIKRDKLSYRTNDN